MSCASRPADGRWHALRLERETRATRRDAATVIGLETRRGLGMLPAVSAAAGETLRDRIRNAPAGRRRGWRPLGIVLVRRRRCVHSSRLSFLRHADIRAVHWLASANPATRFSALPGATETEMPRSSGRLRE
ncbi:MAG: hypothetical protein OJF62_003323 [Pseudolabrys sp.]|nr:hypothetical protein [Pseudolabrys sp.]